jgi:uncharacterized membrane protein SpoIIM required for sporulation
MRSVSFRREREASWAELEDLIALADRHGVRSLTASQMARLPHLYRATLSSLSVARSISLDQAVVQYLESLVGRAYFVVYGTRQSLRSQLWDFLAWRWPQAVRDRWRALSLSIVLMGVGGVVAFLMTRDNMDYYYTFVGDMAQGRTPASSTSELRGGLYDEASVSSVLGTFAAQLFSHNARIGILAFALGFVVGLPTAFLLFYNGLVLGSFAALYASRGLSIDLWGWLLPHGVTELLAVILCGAGGFTIAAAIAFPGVKSRLENLRDHGRDAARIVIGCVVMLFIAGIIEGVFRQTVTSVPARYAVAGTTAVWWLFYFLVVGRGREAEHRFAQAQAQAAGQEVVR